MICMFGFLKEKLKKQSASLTEKAKALLDGELILSEKELDGLLFEL